MTTHSIRDQLRQRLADLKMPGALEAIDGILAQVDSGQLGAAAAIGQLLDAQIGLRNNRRLQAAMRSSRLPAIKTLRDFDFAFQPSIETPFVQAEFEMPSGTPVARSREVAFTIEQAARRALRRTG